MTAREVWFVFWPVGLRVVLMVSLRFVPPRAVAGHCFTFTYSPEKNGLERSASQHTSKCSYTMCAPGTKIMNRTQLAKTNFDEILGLTGAVYWQFFVCPLNMYI